MLRVVLASVSLGLQSICRGSRSSFSIPRVFSRNLVAGLVEFAVVVVSVPRLFRFFSMEFGLWLIFSLRVSVLVVGVSTCVHVLVAGSQCRSGALRWYLWRFYRIRLGC